MSLWQRIKLILSSNINAVVSKAEEPDKILEQLLVEMRNQYRDAKVQVGRAIADEKRLRAQLDQEASQVGEWEKKARLALKSSDEELAKKALLRKREVEGRVATLQEQWEGQKNAVEGLKVALAKLNDKIEEAKRQKDVLIARHKRAVAKQEIHDTLSGISDPGTFDTFDRMTGKVEQAEAQAAASEELGQLTAGDTLEEEFKALEEADVGDSLLAELMERVEAEEEAANEDGVVDAELSRLKALMAGTPGPTIDVEVEEPIDS